MTDWPMDSALLATIQTTYLLLYVVTVGWNGKNKYLFIFCIVIIEECVPYVKIFVIVYLLVVRGI